MIVRKARITDRSSVGVAFVSIHHGETPVNMLTVDKLDPISKIPELKVCSINIGVRNRGTQECPS